MHAYRSWRNQLIIFDDVDVNMLFEVEVEGKKTIRPHILRGVNHKEPAGDPERNSGLPGRASRKPGVNVHRMVCASAGVYAADVPVGAFQKSAACKGLLRHGAGHFCWNVWGGSGWGIPVPNHTLQITLGGIKPGIAADRVEIL